jgi:hypothetical protein
VDVKYTKSSEQLFQEIEANGFAKIDNAIPAAELELLRAYIAELKEKNQGSFAIVGHENLAESPLGELYLDHDFLQLQADLVAKKTQTTILPSESKYQVLRVLNGGNVNSQSHLFHFDNYTLTILLPIFIPDNSNGKNGDLLVLPNIRKISKSANKDALIKILTQNPLTRKLLKLSAVRKLLKFQSVKLEPGNLYFFWGFSSYHGNDDCDEGEVRSTALFHFHKTVSDKSVLSALTSTKKRSRIKG